MRIAVLGMGNVGRTLGAAWVRAGHTVVFGTRDPRSDKTESLLADVEASLEQAQTDAGVASAASMADAAAAADVVVLAVPGTAVEDLLAEWAPELDGKLVVDATNRIAGSLGDQAQMNNVATVASYAPGARVARAFNTLGWENFAEPCIGDRRADLLFCAPPEERAALEALVADVGLRPVYVGDMSTLEVIDRLAALWGALAFGQGLGRRLFFNVVTPADI